MEVGWKQRHRVAKNHVNNFNNFFLERKWCNPVDLRHLAVEKFKNKQKFKKLS